MMGREAELIEAARGGNYPQVEKILSNKPKKAGPFASLRRAQGGICSRDSRGYTALHYAALNGHKDVAALLLSYEASCNSVDDAGSSPLHLASWAGHGDLVRVLLETGPSIPNVNLTNGDKETSLHCAAQYGHVEAVQLLLDAGADPNIKNIREETALDHAAQYGRIATVNILLETHPEMVGKYTAYGGMLYTHTPLHLASRNGHKEVVVELLRVGMDINIRTSRGTALHEAALCGKVEVVRTLLEHDINTVLRDSADRTVIDIMAELQTQRTREIARIILSHTGVSVDLESPYENHPGSLLESPGLDSPVRPRAPSWNVREPRGARSVEELDKRISSFSTTSGCSDCTTSTLQGAKSYESSFMSESEMTMTGTLTRGTRDDDTSISSASSSGSLESAECQESSGAGACRPASRVSQSTLTSSKPVAGGEKPKIPAKPAHIRPGLKPVQIPNVDDKLGLKPKKPPRRNHSISPIRTHHWESEGYDDSSIISSKKVKVQKSVYSSKAGSKSFDELDDILSNKPRKSSGKKRSRRTMSTISGSDVLKAKEQEYFDEEDDRRNFVFDSSETCGLLLNSVSNKALAEDASCSSRDRYISQKQYKRKIRRESAGSQPAGYATLDLKTEKRLSNGHDNSRGCTKIVSKTTYKLKKFNGAENSELDSAGEENYERSNGLELMEIPLSPTHYEQPPTPDHEPPSAWEAESAIHNVLSFLRNEYNPKQRSTGTTTEPWMMLSLDQGEWPSQKTTNDQETSTRQEVSGISGRKLPPLPPDLPLDPPVCNNVQEPFTSDVDDDDNVTLRQKNNTDNHKEIVQAEAGCIYQTIDYEDYNDTDTSSNNSQVESKSNPAAKNNDASQNVTASVLSPFNEDEEWSKISQIINTFGADIGQTTENNSKEASTPNNSPVYDYPTLKRREKLAETVADWLKYINMEKYTTNFEGNGYDDIHFMGGGVMKREDLVDIGITDAKDCTVLIDSLKDRSNNFDFDSNQEPKNTLIDMNLEDWLKKIKLEQYIQNFKDNLMTEMDRVVDIWDEELVSILEIDRVGHRNRILLSVAGPKGIKKRVGKIDTIRRKSVDKSKKEKKSASVDFIKKTSKSSLSPTDDSTAMSATESDVSISVSYPTTTNSDRRYTSTSSASEGSDKPPTPSKTKRTSVESGTLTLGRKKKRAPPPPTGQVSPQMPTKDSGRSLDGSGKAKTLIKLKGNNTIERSDSRSKGKEKEKTKKSSQSFSKSYKAKYHGNNLVKDFKGIETTREAIEKVKSSKDIINRTGMPVTMLITDKEVKISIFEGKEPIHQHDITNISCIVYDTDNMCMFGYITSDIDNLQRFSHVFSAENKERASEILTAICKGYKENTIKQSQNLEKEFTRKSAGPSKVTTSGVELRKVSYV